MYNITIIAYEGITLQLLPMKVYMP